MTFTNRRRLVRVRKNVDLVAGAALGGFLGLATVAAIGKTW